MSLFSLIFTHCWFLFQSSIIIRISEEKKEGIIIILSDARELSESEAAGASGRILEPRLLHLKEIWEKCSFWWKDGFVNNWSIFEFATFLLNTYLDMVIQWKTRLYESIYFTVRIPDFFGGMKCNKNLFNNSKGAAISD